MHTILHRSAMCGVFALSLGMLAVPFVARSEGSTQVRIDNFTFGPGKISVAKGSTVTWTNEDDIPHTVVLTALGVRSKTLDTDKAFTYQFDKAGTFAYICGLHPNMHGQVVVR
jgi:plastocyanin